MAKKGKRPAKNKTKSSAQNKEEKDLDKYDLALKNSNRRGRGGS